MLRSLPVVVMLCVCGARSAQAQSSPDDARAQELYDRGVLRYQEGAYADAIAAWEAGHALSPRPLFLFNLANAAERMADWQAASDYLRDYADVAPEEELPTIARRIQSLEERWAAEQHAEEAEGRWWVVPVAALSVGGAAAIAGTALGVSTRQTRLEIEPLCIDEVCKAAAQPLVARQRTTAIATDLAFGVAVVAVGVGVGSLVVPNTAVSLGPGGLHVSGRF